MGVGAVTGGLTNGTIAAFNDRDFLRGNLKVSSLVYGNLESIPVSGYKEMGKSISSPKISHPNI